MRVIISHNMSGLTREEVLNIRTEAINYLRDKLGNDIEIIDNYNHDFSPDELGVEWYFDHDPSFLPILSHTGIVYNDRSEFDKDYSYRLWHLGRSIQQIGQADAIYFVPHNSDSKGCIVEKLISDLYGIPIIE